MWVVTYILWYQSSMKSGFLHSARTWVKLKGELQPRHLLSGWNSVGSLRFPHPTTQLVVDGCVLTELDLRDLVLMCTDDMACKTILKLQGVSCPSGVGWRLYPLTNVPFKGSDLRFAAQSAESLRMLRGLGRVFYWLKKCKTQFVNKIDSIHRSYRSNHNRNCSSLFLSDIPNRTPAWSWISIAI